MDTPDSSHTQSAAPAEPGSSELKRFEFSGNGAEYFRIWIVNLALSIITIGIYSAWAKVRRLRYFYGHTTLDGQGFDYLADPKRILVGRIIAVALLLVYSQSTTWLPDYAFYIVCLFVLVIPFVIVTSSAFTMRNSSYRNIRFHFTKNFREAYRVTVPPVAMALLLAGLIYFSLPDTFIVGDTSEGESTTFVRTDLLLQIIIMCMLPILPWLDFLRTRFIITHTRYGNLKGEFTATLSDFYILYVKYLFIGIGVMIGVVLIGSIVIGGVVGVISAASAQGEASPGVMISIILVVILAYAASFYIFAWLIAQRNNLIRGSTRFGELQMQGNFRFGELAGIMITNLLAIMVSLGLLFPWTKIRVLRYSAEHTSMETAGLDQVVAHADEDQNALGEEIGEFFDIDLGL